MCGGNVVVVCVVVCVWVRAKRNMQVDTSLRSSGIHRANLIFNSLEYEVGVHVLMMSFDAMISLI